MSSEKPEHFNREKLKKPIAITVVKTASTVSKIKTDFLLAGENVGLNKLTKSNELNIPVIAEEEFLKMIKKNRDLPGS